MMKLLFVVASLLVASQAQRQAPLQISLPEGNALVAGQNTTIQVTEGGDTVGKNFQIHACLTTNLLVFGIGSRSGSRNWHCRLRIKPLSSAICRPRRGPLQWRVRPPGFQRSNCLSKLHLCGSQWYIGDCFDSSYACLFTYAYSKSISKEFVLDVNHIEKQDLVPSIEFASASFDVTSVVW